MQNKYGLDVLVAEGEHQASIHNALYDELAKGLFLPETRVEFRAAIADLVNPGPLIDTTVAHAVAAVDRAPTDTVPTL